MQTANATLTPMRDHATLEKLNLNFIRSVQESDARWFEQNLDQDFVNSNPDGTLSERAAFIAFIARPCPVTNLKCEDVRIRLLGDTAIIHARTAYLKPDGGPGTGRYTDLWMRRERRWLCVAAHVTRG
jgi:ketosteroid isomerase-like protein